MASAPRYGERVTASAAKMTEQRHRLALGGGADVAAFRVEDQVVVGRHVGTHALQGGDPRRPERLEERDVDLDRDDLVRHRRDELARESLDPGHVARKLLGEPVGVAGRPPGRAVRQAVPRGTGGGPAGGRQSRTSRCSSRGRQRPVDAGARDDAPVGGCSRHGHSRGHAGAGGRSPGTGRAPACRPGRGRCPAREGDGRMGPRSRPHRRSPSRVACGTRCGPRRSRCAAHRTRSGRSPRAPAPRSRARTAPGARAHRRAASRDAPPAGPGRPRGCRGAAAPPAAPAGNGRGSAANACSNASQAPASRLKPPAAA